MRSLKEFFINLLRRTSLYEAALQEDTYEKRIEDEIYNIADDLVVLNYIKLIGLNIEPHSRYILLECLNSSIWLAGRFNIPCRNLYKRKLRMVNKVCDEVEVENYDFYYDNANYVIQKFYEDFKYSLSTDIDIEDAAKLASLETIKQIKEIKHLIALHDKIEIEKWTNKIF